MSGGNLAALRYRPLRAYMAGNLVSNCGTWIQNIALAVLAYRITGGSTFWVGVTGFSQFAAVGVLAPWSGPAADRLDRRAIGMTTAVVNAALGAGLALLSALGAASIGAACALAFLSGVANAFAVPALKALVTSLVPPDDIGRALALESASYNVARVVGPVVGAVVVATAGTTWAFAINGCTWLALVAGLWSAPSGRPASTARGAADGGATLGAAARVVGRQPTLVAAFAVVVGISMASDAVTTLGPEICTEILGRGDTFAGVLVGAFGFGAVTAVILSRPAAHTTPRRLAARCVVMAAGLAGVAVAGSTVAVLGALAVAGAGYLRSNTESSTSIQLGVGDADRGRVSALWSVAFLGTRPLSSLLLGAVASAAGVRAATVVALVPIAGALAVLAWAGTGTRPARQARAVAEADAEAQAVSKSGSVTQPSL